MSVKQRIGGLVLVVGTIALYIFRFTHEYIYIYMRVRVCIVYSLAKGSIEL